MQQQAVAEGNSSQQPVANGPMQIRPMPATMMLAVVATKQLCALSKKVSQVAIPTAHFLLPSPTPSF